jgi:hypothetical protein
MAGDITLKEYLYALTLALLWKAMSHLQHGLGGDALAPLFFRYKLCIPLWALDRWQSVQKLRRRPKTAAFVPEMSVVV